METPIKYKDPGTGFWFVETNKNKHSFRNEKDATNFFEGLCGMEKMTICPNCNRTFLVSARKYNNYARNKWTLICQTCNQNNK